MKKLIILGIILAGLTAYCYQRIQLLPPETFMRLQELSEHYGFPTEEHILKTKEGENLALYRIPNPGKPPVLFHHGLCGSGRQFITLGKKSVAYKVFEQGFDVWIANSRETSYSRPRGGTFDWNYTWEDLALLDLPQMIDFVLEKTQRQKLNYIGHSQGGGIMYALLSEKTEYNDKVNLFVSLAPAVYMHTDYLIPMMLIPEGLFDTFFNGQFLVPEFILAYICAITETFCRTVLENILAPEEHFLTMEELLIFVGDLPEFTSTTNIAAYKKRWAQEELEFRRAKGGVYDISKVSVWQAVFGGTRDRVVPAHQQGAILSRIDATKLKLNMHYSHRDHFNFFVTTRTNELFKDLAMVLSHYKDY